MIVFSPSANAFRFYDSDGDEANSTPLDDQDTNVSVDVNSGNVSIQLRYRIQNTTAVAGSSNDDYRLQFSVNSAAYQTVTTSTSDVIASDSGLTNDAATTDRGTNGITAGTGSFVAGEQCTDGLLDDRQLTASNYTEHVWGITLVAADLVNADTLDFRVSLNGASPGMTNAVTPRITVVKALAITTTASVGVINLTGQTASTKYGRTGVAAQGSYALTGQDATLLNKYTITAVRGLYTLTGQAVDLTSPENVVYIITEAGDRLVTEDLDSIITETGIQGIIADYGEFTLSGQDVTLVKNLTVTIVQGDYVLTGQVSSAVHGSVNTAEQGSYDLTGQDVAFKRDYVLVSVQGSYVLSGQNAALSYTDSEPPVIGAGQGNYVLTGQVAALQADVELAAAQGDYTLTGQSTALTLTRGFTLTAEQGSYILGGQSTSIPAEYVLPADRGSYSLFGQDISFGTIEVSFGADSSNLRKGKKGKKRKKALTWEEYRQKEEAKKQEALLKRQIKVVEEEEDEDDIILQVLTSKVLEHQ